MGDHNSQTIEPIDDKPPETVSQDDVVRRRPGWGFLVWWVLANTVGATVGLFVTNTITHGVFDYGYPMETSRLALDTLRTAVFTGLVLGAVVGFAEWLVLRVFMPTVLWWILATSIGWGLGYAMHVYFLATSKASDSQEMLRLVTFGICISFAQYLVLRRHLKYTELWILANVLAWLIVMATANFVLEDVSETLETVLYNVNLNIYVMEGLALNRFLQQVVFGLWIFGILELITGVTLLWLLRQSNSTHSRNIREFRNSNFPIEP